MQGNVCTPLKSKNSRKDPIRIGRFEIIESNNFYNTPNNDDYVQMNTHYDSSKNYFDNFPFTNNTFLMDSYSHKRQNRKDYLTFSSLVATINLSSIEASNSIKSLEITPKISHFNFTPPATNSLSTDIGVENLIMKYANHDLHQRNKNDSFTSKNLKNFQNRKDNNDCLQDSIYNINNINNLDLDKNLSDNNEFSNLEEADAEKVANNYETNDRPQFSKMDEQSRQLSANYYGDCSCSFQTNIGLINLKSLEEQNVKNLIWLSNIKNKQNYDFSNSSPKEEVQEKNVDIKQRSKNEKTKEKKSTLHNKNVYNSSTIYLEKKIKKFGINRKKLNICTNLFDPNFHSEKNNNEEKEPSKWNYYHTKEHFLNLKRNEVPITKTSIKSLYNNFTSIEEKIQKFEKCLMKLDPYSKLILKYNKGNSLKIPEDSKIIQRIIIENMKMGKELKSMKNSLNRLQDARNE